LQKNQLHRNPEISNLKLEAEILSQKISPNNENEKYIFGFKSVRGRFGSVHLSSKFREEIRKKDPSTVTGLIEEFAFYEL
jgi:hypothetical protein